MKKIFAYSLILAFYSYIFACLAYGQTLSLGIYPPLLEVMIQPGRSITQVYKLSNFGDPIVVNSKISPFAPIDEVGHILLLEEDEKTEQFDIVRNTSSWFSFENANLALNEPFFLPSNKTAEVVLKLKVPKDAPEGDYYQSLVFDSQPTPNIGSTQTRSQVKIVSNILITVSKSGTPVKKGIITEFEVKNQFSVFNRSFEIPFFDSFDQIPITLKVKNVGTAFFKPQGSIKLTGFLQDKSFPILPQNVLAGTTRIIIASDSSYLKPLLINNFKSYSLKLPQNFYLGKFTLETDLTISETDHHLWAKKIQFLAIPYKLLFVLVPIFIILMGKYRHVLKKRK